MKNKHNSIYLQELNIDDVSRDYIKWLNNYSVVRFTEQKFYKHTIKSVKKFVIEKKKKKDEFLLGIFLSNKKIHVGNIKLGPINHKHKYAEISYFIGEKRFQNLGLGSLAIKKVCKIAKTQYKLKKLIAGVYEKNIPSKKVLEKNKFILEGFISKKYLFEGRRISELIYGKLL